MSAAPVGLLFAVAASKKHNQHFLDFRKKFASLNLENTAIPFFWMGGLTVDVDPYPLSFYDPNDMQNFLASMDQL